MLFRNAMERKKSRDYVDSKSFGLIKQRCSQFWAKLAQYGFPVES
jgi:hypothetical protein